MLQYIIRRVLYAFPLLLGVNVLTFVLFFVVNSPDDMRRRLPIGNNSEDIICRCFGIPKIGASGK